MGDKFNEFWSEIVKTGSLLSRKQIAELFWNRALEVGCDYFGEYGWEDYDDDDKVSWMADTK